MGSVADNGFITAHAGGGQSLATRITRKKTIINVCATIADSVKFPPAAPGDEYTLINLSGKAVNVFPSEGNKFYGKATDAALSLLTNNRISVICYSGENKTFRF